MKAIFFAAALTATALLLAGCGGSSSSSSDTTTASSGGGGSSSGSGTALQGTVGPGFTISLDQNGSKVSSLEAGTYTITVDDKSDIHNFHLTGPGVDKATDVGSMGTEKWTVDLKAGTYDYQCDPHASTMHGSFTVT
jgi:plastocyanin